MPTKASQHVCFIRYGGNGEYHLAQTSKVQSGFMNARCQFVAHELLHPRWTSFVLFDVYRVVFLQKGWAGWGGRKYISIRKFRKNSRNLGPWNSRKSQELVKQSRRPKRLQGTHGKTIGLEAWSPRLPPSRKKNNTPKQCPGTRGERPRVMNLAIV